MGMKYIHLFWAGKGILKINLKGITSIKNVLYIRGSDYFNGHFNSYFRMAQRLDCANIVQEIKLFKCHGKIGLQFLKKREVMPWEVQTLVPQKHYEMLSL